MREKAFILFYLLQKTLNLSTKYQQNTSTMVQGIELSQFCSRDFEETL